MKRYHTVLTIAGSDSGGGAGIQADLKTISACGCYGMSAVTAITAQNTQGVTAIHPVPVDILEAQIRAVLEDIGTDAIKIGMLHSREVISCVVKLIREYVLTTIVLDPVMVATSGDRLIQQDAVAAMRDLLFPLVKLITPNIAEAQILLGAPVETAHDIGSAASRLAERFNLSVLVKGGHLHGNEVEDALFDLETGTLHTFNNHKIITRNTHGTGCTLSSAITSFLAKGLSLKEAVKTGIHYITEAINVGAAYQIGHGHGPVHHFHRFWQ